MVGIPIGCLRCGAAAEGATCPGCGARLPVLEEGDYFAVFGYPRCFVLDERELKERYFALSRRLHPDGHPGKNSEEQSAILSLAALVNNAYKVLRDQRRRFEYLLALEFPRDPEKRDGRFSAKYFELAEAFEEAAARRGEARLEGLAQVEAQVRKEQEMVLETLGALAQQWDARRAPGTGSAPADAGEGRRLLAEIRVHLDDLAYAEKMLARIHEARLAA